ncbi:ABC transporter permease [Thermococcus barophilus]|nr:ABC transporter permease [Thermococcus barophilus]
MDSSSSALKGYLPVLKWFTKRLLIALITIYFAVTLSFFVVKAMPGDPVQALIQMFISQYYMDYDSAKSLAEAAAPFIPKGSVLHQYVSYLVNFIHGNLGVSISYSTGTPVWDLLVQAIPWTVLVVGSALIISFAIGILIGTGMAYVHGSKIDSFLAVFFSIIRSIPEYVVALVLLIVFGFHFRWFPTRGAYSPNVTPRFNLPFIKDVLKHAALPILSWVIVHVSGWALSMRASTVTVLGEDYITYAKIRGLPSRRILISYIGKNAILPLFTSFMLSIGFMFGGSVFIEYIFAYPGVGNLLYQAITMRDTYLMLGVFNIIIVAVVISALIADILYGVIDPRIRRGA